MLASMTQLDTQPTTTICCKAVIGFGFEMNDFYDFHGLHLCLTRMVAMYLPRTNELSCITYTIVKPSLV
jgi:hypothetical protein